MSGTADPYILHYYPGNASLLPHMMLREIGAPFELRLVDRDAGAQRDPAYLRLNPHGRIPVLVRGDTVLYETAPIALHLAECHPDAGLAPPPGDPLRPDFLKWMVHLANTPQPEYRAWFYPHEHVADPAAAPAVKAQAEVRLRGMFERIAGLLGALSASLTSLRGIAARWPWLLGERFSAADLFLFMLIRWGRAMPHPPRTLAPLGGLAERVMARPAVRAAFAAEGLGEPLF